MSNVDHPDHYHRDSGIEVIEIIEAWNLNFSRGNVLKYLARAGAKSNELEDLEKCLWYLQREIERVRKQ